MGIILVLICGVISYAAGLIIRDIIKQRRAENASKNNSSAL